MDQPQFWCDRSKPYQFIPISKIAEEFRNSRQGQDLQAILSTPYDKSKSDPSALPKTKYAVPRWEIFRACVSRELLLMKRHRFIFFFRIVQIICVATLGCTSFIRTRMHTSDLINGELYLSALFFSLNAILFNGFSELSMTLARLPVFYKQRDNLFYPAWSWSIANFLTRVPVTIIETSAWSLVMYFSVGFSPGAARFFRFVLLLIAVHQMAVGIFRLIAALARDRTVAVTFGSLAIMAIFMLGGFIIPKEMIKPWWIWGYWVSPLTYAQRAIAVNEFTATRWVERLADDNTSLGKKILKLHSLPSDDYWYWLGVGVLIAYALLFNFGAAIALTCLNPFGGAQTILPKDDNDSQGNSTTSSGNDRFKKKGMILPFQPLAMTFHNVNYFVDMPSGMISQGISETKLQLLNNVSGVLSPGVLTALMGASGAGKTTLLDVLSGRKTTGYIEGDVKISGYPKEQSTFARISGYVEQNDIHSPELTVYESLLFSAILRLPEEVDGRKRKEFVEEVMQLVELDMIRDAVVGLPGVTGLSTEQRKRLTIAVELVANPSIIFMDEPTSGLDARAAAIVMRTVRNTVDTGRTVVCTIHQPSIEIFLSFDELLLLKPGGKAIYGGKIGEDAQTLINYFQGIRGVPPFPSGYNPANWMLEVTTTAVEERIGEDFSVIYQDSQQQRNVESSIHRLSVPPEHSKPLEFSTTYARGSFSQFKICFWRQNIIYWRNTRYKGVAMGFTILCGILIGTVFWDVGSKRGSTQALYVLMGALYSTAIFLGVNNASTVQPIISIGRTVFCRERAAGMYSALPLALAQGLVEIPYILVQTLIYCCITYFMINFERTPVKFFLYMLFAFLTFAYYTFFGIMCVGLTPNFNLCTVLTSAFYSIWNLFSGFLLPRPNIPPWWIWLYYICPVSWSLRGIITSQLGDVETMIDEPIFRGTVKEYIKFRFGFDSGMLGPTVAVLIAFCVFFFSVYVISVRFLNFQKR